jgi:Transcriptional regulator containing PAS, AAA-type ATPase, and DNA-binding domains
LILNDDARAVFHSLREGINIIDTEGRIVFGNQAYCNFLNQEVGYDLGVIEGRFLRDLRPNAQLPEVLRAGKPLMHLARQETKDIYFVNMYPIYQQGSLVGGISVVTFLDQAYQAKEELESMELRNKQVLHRISKANGAKYSFPDIVAVSPLSLQTKELAEKIADTDATVLLESESGTGKELYAQAIHNHSPRRKGIFVAINCSNFTQNMLESELFGYVEGAFTGAKKGGKIGLFEAAAGGSLFLDEVSELDLSLQAKLLRALQERKIRPVGSIQELDIDVRIIAACNAKLSDYIQAGKFRKDLYYRLNTFPIQIPPLRERIEDIPTLAYTILDELSRKLRRSITITAEAISTLQAHDWPGNVRELRNVLEFSAYLAPGGIIAPENLPQGISHHDDSPDLTLAERTQAFQKREIRRLLEINGSDLAGKKKTAQQLGISLSGLYSKISD